MGFLDDLKIVGSDLLAKGGDAAKDAMVKAQDAAEMAKIKVDIAAREKEIKDLYMEIGRKYYEQYKDDDADFQAEIVQIHEKLEKIKELRSRYEMHKDAVRSNNKEAFSEDTVNMDLEAVMSEAEDAEVIDIVITPEADVAENTSEEAISHEMVENVSDQEE